MAETLTFPQLSLNLPSTRISVDFSKITSNCTIHSAIASTYDDVHRNVRLRDAPPNARQNHTLSDRPLPEVPEESEPGVASLSRQGSLRWRWMKTRGEHGEKASPPTQSLSRTVSNASSASATSSSAWSVFSRAHTSVTHTSYSSSQPNSRPLSPFKEELLDLGALPLSILEQIISYALALPKTVSIGPETQDNRHLRYRYHRAGLAYVDLRRMLNHSLFLTSHHIRNISLDVLFSKAEFVVDLHSIYHTRTSSTMSENLKKHFKFWIQNPPKMVQDALQRLSKLHVRLPVPSTEAGVRKGREEDDWMDGSDGQGGGSWRVKSMKKEQEDAQEVQKCLDAIIEMVMSSRISELRPSTPKLSRSLSNLSLRRNGSMKSKRSARSQSAHSDRENMEEGDAHQSRSLKRLDVVLVKRSPWASVLQESLQLVRALRSVPVTGFTRYHFELNEQKYCWATKYRKRWKGFEPDGARLLGDLQGLTVADAPIEPIQTPTEFKFVKVDKKGQLSLLESAIPKTPIVLESPRSKKDALPNEAPKAVRRKALPRFLGRPRKNVDSFAFIMEEGMSESGNSGTGKSRRNEPPTIEELRQIADDIRAGRY
ncbi:hypothetical protein EJ04DRAFT_41384 [Polyplosphaeria fusca]|uniref:Uncharacterized protein n=1 Tax=Polyplosphaeria fusca TaxID=682080 RepID=A0A9P4V7N0_9PLEO|nr:hypothetical protein EJ04DRAFT_41384 [Polyplosphaeria fusca]